MEHKHVKHTSPRWRSDTWECECGFETMIIKAFISHLEQNRPMEKKGGIMPDKEFRELQRKIHTGIINLIHWQAEHLNQTGKEYIIAGPLPEAPE